MKLNHASLRLIPAALLLVSAPLLTACGGSSGTIVDSELGEFYIKTTPASAPAGDVTFHITNAGEDTHEFVVLKTDLADDKLPLNKDGDADEEASGITSPGELENIAAGTTGDLTLPLTSGHYVLICNLAMTEPDGTIEHHYPLGMHTSFTVE